MRILEHGTADGFKAGVHAFALGVAGLMGLYNAFAWLQRRERHLAINAGLYSLATLWEIKQVQRHLNGRNGHARGGNGAVGTASVTPFAESQLRAQRELIASPRPRSGRP